MSKIAWIEDDYWTISSLVRPLELDGHDILYYRTCQDVEEHLTVICECDAVILDIILPPATDDLYQGVSVLRKLREECKYNGPVIVCSVVKNPVVLSRDSAVFSWPKTTLPPRCRGRDLLNPHRWGKSTLK